MKYVVGFMFDERDESLLLIEKQNPEWQRGKLNGIGGKIEAGETPEDAMAREFHEEVGFHHDAVNWTLGIHLIGPDYEVFFFKTVGCTRLAKWVEKERPVVTESWRDLPKNVIFNLNWMIPMMRDSSLRLPIMVHDVKADADSSGTAD